MIFIFPQILFPEIQAFLQIVCISFYFILRAFYMNTVALHSHVIFFSAVLKARNIQIQCLQ